MLCSKMWASPVIESAVKGPQLWEKTMVWGQGGYNTFSQEKLRNRNVNRRNHYISESLIAGVLIKIYIYVIYDQITNNE